MSEELEVRGYLVRGVVQGVGFRWFTRRTGEGLGVAGHVRNLPDGSVEVHARGRPSALDDLEESLQKGPPMSRVASVERVPADPRTPERGFLMETW